MRASIREVATLADVSAMTVSRVLNGQADKVAAATRERILDAVRELDYVPVAQPAAQQRANHTRVISLVFDQVDELRDYVGTEIHVGMRDSARTHGYDLLTVLRESPAWAGEREEVRFLDRRSDGLIFVNAFRRYSLMEKLIQHEVPLVGCCGLEAPEGAANIKIDDTSSVRAIVQHLHERGHREIGFIAGPKELGAAGREIAFKKGLAELGLPDTPSRLFKGTAGDSWVSDQVLIAEALTQAQNQGLTALMCANDYLAAAVLKIASQLGIEAPGQMAITGFDDVPLAERRGITTVHSPFAHLGYLAVDAIVGMLGGASAAEVSKSVQASLVVRESTA